MSLGWPCVFLILGAASPADSPVAPDETPAALPSTWTEPERTPAPRRAPPNATDGLLAPGNYAYVTPGLGGLTPVADAAAFAYVWGLGVGRYMIHGRRFAATAGAFVEHVVLMFPPVEEGVGVYTLNSLRVGPELRLGGRSRRTFAYGMFRLGVDLTFDYELYDEYDAVTRYPVYPWLIGAVGGGCQFLVRPRVVLGVEGGPDLGGEAFFMLRARFLVSFRF